MRKNIFVIASILSCCFTSSFGSTNDSIVNKLTQYVTAVNNFAHFIPQEKVYLHFDNNCYYEKDKIWFKAYVVTSELNKATNLSKTLYVDLLNQGGDVVEKKVLEIKDGQCSGDFTLDHAAFYSGFYEVRAYTKYMLNFDHDAMFSRVFPVFELPEEDGEYSERKMVRDIKDYPMKREVISKGKAFNVKFFPEGGNLVKGIESRVAFQVTDERGDFIDTTGTISVENNERDIVFSTTHNGRGFFTYTPQTEKAPKAQIKYNDKVYNITLPEALPQGYVMDVDNLTDEKNINVSIKNNMASSVDQLGLVLLSGGKIYHMSVVDFSNRQELSLAIPKTEIPTSGVTQVILFDREGRILSDRLIFAQGSDDYLTIKGRRDKDSYAPFEPVEMDFSVADSKNNPVRTSFSLSVKDAKDDVFYADNVKTNLLLSSDLKGYIHNPSYYFESNDAEHQQALDLLLMVQGWRRYDWMPMAGLSPFEINFAPEQGVEIRGEITSWWRKKRKTNMDVSLYLSRMNEDSTVQAEMLQARSDSMGRFRIISSLEGKWDMVLGVSEKGKKKKENILLDRLFRPDPRKHESLEFKVSLTKDYLEKMKKIRLLDNLAQDTLFPLPDDAKLGMDKKIHQLEEVTISGKFKYKDIFEKTIAYYDALEVVNDIIDDGGPTTENIRDLLVLMDPNFTCVYDHFAKNKKTGALGDHVYKYKGKDFNLVFADGQYWGGVVDRFDITRASAIKSIRISTANSSALVEEQSGGVRKEVGSAFEASQKAIKNDSRSYTVFIELHKDGAIPNGAKGMRKLKLEGYDLQTEFYNPDYSVLPKGGDYRRTLYWNPNVETDDKGEAKVNFYNNINCRQMIISAETITPEGVFGLYTDE